MEENVSELRYMFIKSLIQSCEKKKVYQIRVKRVKKSKKLLRSIQKQHAFKYLNFNLFPYI